MYIRSCDVVRTVQSQLARRVFRAVMFACSAKLPRYPSVVRLTLCQLGAVAETSGWLMERQVVTRPSVQLLPQQPCRGVFVLVPAASTFVVVVQLLFVIQLSYRSTCLHDADIRRCLLSFRHVDIILDARRRRGDPHMIYMCHSFVRNTVKIFPKSQLLT